MTAGIPREAASQKPPDGGLDLSQFPSRRLRPQHRVYRAFAAARSPGWYSSDTLGRFNLRAPNGTLYAADTVRAAVRERLGPDVTATQEVSLALVQTMAVATLALRADRCANLTDETALDWGVTRELDVMVPYRIPQQWAAAFFAWKFDGIHYGARHTTGKANAWALFGGAGAAEVRRTAEDLGYEDACATAGLTIIGKPSSFDGADVAVRPAQPGS